MQNKKLLSLLGLAALSLNLGVATVVYGQEDTKAEVEVGCSVLDPSLPSVDETLSFASVSFSGSLQTTDIAAPFSITIIDPRGNECLDENDNPIQGINLTIDKENKDLAHFNLNNAPDPNTSIAISDLTFNPITFADNISVTTGDPTTGVSNTNITLLSTPSSFSDNDSIPTIQLLNATNTFGGTIVLTLDEDDIELDIPANTPIGSYTYPLVITLS